jgi:cytochrome c553
MRQIALRLAPDDVAAVSDWLASRPVPVPATPAAASASRPPPGLDCGGSDSLRVSSSGSTR